MSTTNLKPCRTNNTYKFITVLFKEILQIEAGVKQFTL